MKASAKTLQDFVNLLPVVLAKRYQPAFTVAVANEILAEIEQACDPDYLVAETGLLLLENVTDYVLPASVRNIRGLYGVVAGDLVPDKNHPIAHEVHRNTLRLACAPHLSATANISGTVSAAPPADKTKVYDSTAGKLDTALDEDELKSRLVKVTHANGTIEYRILSGNTPTSKVADINGELDALALAGDTYTITANFLMIEHLGYLSRFPGTGATPLAVTVDIPQDFEFLFRTGLTAKYHLQADSLSNEASAWGKQYADQLQGFRIDTTKARGTATRNQPRSLPSLF